jgi:signal transduction histidine kinase/CheY-like chemotaxis protein
MEGVNSPTDFEISILNKIKNQFIQFFVLTVSAMVILLLILYIIFGGNYLVGLIGAIIIDIVIIILQWKKKDQLVGHLLFIPGSILVFIQCYIQHSGMVLCILGLFLVASSILRSFKFTTWLFICYLGGIGVFMGLGILNIGQEFIPGSSIALVNNVQIAIPVLFLSFILSFFVSRILVTSIAQLHAQNLQLQQAQEGLISQTRVESIQLLAAGLSHDFNNMLMGFSGNIELMLDSPNMPENIIDSLKDMQQISLQARNLSNSLMTLAKQKDKIQMTPFNMKDLIENVVKFALSGRKSKAIVECGPDLMGAYGDPIQISQVIQNLIINADQAMDEGGIIKVQAYNLTLKEQNPYHLLAGDYLKIQVIDEGSGIPEKYQSQIFNPFFTTKSAGKGLGLTLCHSIIQNHNGYINFHSKKGTGTEFFFIIPATTLPPTDQNLSEEKWEQFNGLVLILEDNRNVLSVLENYLHSFGLQTIGMTESTTFLRQLEQSVKASEKIDLILIDLTLPGDIGGKEMVTKIRALAPNSYIIASSGYSQDYVETNFDMTQFNNFLHKPYSKHELQILLKRWVEKRSFSE